MARALSRPSLPDDLGDFSSTQAFIRDVLRLHNQAPVSDHLEVETYTWNVLPEHLRTGGMDHAIARELTWVREELSA
jgi:hypothetical protein